MQSDASTDTFIIAKEESKGKDERSRPQEAGDSKFISRNSPPRDDYPSLSHGDLDRTTSSGGGPETTDCVISIILPNVSV